MESFLAALTVLSLFASFSILADESNSSLRYRPPYPPRYYPPYYYPSTNYYPNTSPSPSPSSTPSMTESYSYKTNLGPYGAYLSDYKGKAIYTFSKDARGGPSNCYDQCAQEWTPIIIPYDQNPNALPNAKQEYFGRIQRTDGSYQVTYNGWPCYYYKYDQNVYDYTGFKKDAYGGTWYLLRPDGSWMK